jgi:hypothetical protein
MADQSTENFDHRSRLAYSSSVMTYLQLVPQSSFLLVFTSLLLFPIFLIAFYLFIYRSRVGCTRPAFLVQVADLAQGPGPTLSIPLF